MQGLWRYKAGLCQLDNTERGGVHLGRMSPAARQAKMKALCSLQLH